MEELKKHIELTDREESFGLGELLLKEKKFIFSMLALDAQNAIGIKGGLLCHLPTDLAHFKRQTENETVILGSKTLKSLPKKLPLPNRHSIILTHQKELELDLKKALDKRKNTSEISFSVLNRPTDISTQKIESDFLIVMGGAQIYNLLLMEVHAILVTHIKHSFSEADVYFSEIDLKKWHIVAESEPIIDGEYEYSVKLYVSQKFWQIAKEQESDKWFIDSLNKILIKSQFNYKKRKV